MRGCARSISDDAAEGVPWIERGVADYRAGGAHVGLLLWLPLQAEAFHLVDRTSDALEAIREAQGLAEKFEVRFWSAELHRLRGVFLVALGSNESQIEAAFQVAIRNAKEQKSVSLEESSEATYAEYRRQKASGSGGCGIRLRLC